MLGVTFCREIGIYRVMLEGDALQVVNLQRGPKPDQSCGGLLVADTRRIFNSFVDWSVSHVSRKFNIATHCLAKDALSCGEDLYDLEEVPECICHIVCDEMV